MVALRTTLRKTHDEMIAAGPGARLGVRDFGVFYVQRMSQRYVVRDGKVFEVPERDVLKLRPPGADPTELTEVDDLRINQDIDFGAGSIPWNFKSTSRANRFEVVLPNTYAGNAYDFVRDPFQNETSYVLAKSTLSDTDLSNTQGIFHVVSTDEVLAIRYSKSLRSVTQQAPGGEWGELGNMTFSADLPTVGFKSLADPTYYRLVLAWFRQRAIDIADR